MTKSKKRMPLDKVSSWIFSLGVHMQNILLNNGFVNDSLFIELQPLRGNSYEIISSLNVPPLLGNFLLEVDRLEECYIVEKIGADIYPRMGYRK